MKIGWIGTGNIGAAIVETLLGKGHQVYVHNRTEAKAQTLILKGAVWCGTPAEIGSQCQLVFLCISGMNAANSILFNDTNGLLKNNQQVDCLVDLSTTHPDDAAVLCDKLKSANVNYISCPVSGGVEGAEKGELAAIVSDPFGALKKYPGVLTDFIRTITYVDSPQKAQILKILNNLAESINLCGALEILKIGEKLNCSIDEMRQAFLSCRGRSAYMGVAIDYLKSETQSTNVGLDVRHKDICFAESLIDRDANYVVSETVIALYKNLFKELSPDSDQCDYYKQLHPGIINK